MKSLAIIPATIALLALSLNLAACGDSTPAETQAEAETADEAGHAEEGHSHEEAGHADELVKGPNGGRLLSDGDFALEIRIFEDGVPPEFRLYPTQGGKPVPLQEVQATMALRRRA